MNPQSLHHPAAISRRGPLIAVATAAMLVVAMLAAAQTPARADGSTPPGATKTMTLSNANGGTSLALGDVVTVAFDDGVTPVGTSFDIWFCPDKTIAPIDGGGSGFGDCEAVVFAGRDGATNVLANAGSRAVKDNVLTLTWVFGTEDEEAYFSYPGNTYENIFVDNNIPVDEFCDYVGWYLVVQDYDEDNKSGGHSNFLGPLAPTGCGPEGEAPAAPLPPVMVCSPDPVVPGGTVTCALSNGPVDHVALWRASFDGSVFASTGVRFGPDGVGSFSFIAPRGAACGAVTVELVEWLPPITVSVACSAVPSRVPAGEGGLPLGAGLFGLMGVAGAVLAGRRLVSAA
jgi:hypothetical protein